MIPTNLDPRADLYGSMSRALLCLVVSAIVIAFGFAIGYVRYGEAVELRTKIVAQQQRIVDLENDWDISTKLVKREWLAGEYQGCLSDLATCERGGEASRP